MFCPNCGKQIDDGTKFCVYCGFKLEITEAPVVPAAEAGAALSTGVEEAAPQPVQQEFVPQPAPQPVQQAFVPQPVQPVQQEFAPQPVQPIQQEFAPQPAQPQYAPVKKNGMSGGRKAGGIILAILAAIILLPAIILGSIRMCTSKGSMKSLINKAVNESGGIGELLYEEVIDEFGERYGEAFLEDDSLKDLSAKVASEAIQFMILGEGDPIDVDAIMDYVEDNKKAISRAIDEDIDSRFLKSLRRELEDVSEELREEVIEPEALLVQALIGTTTFLLLVAIVVIMFIGIALLCGKFYDRTFKYIGIPSLVSGSIMLLVGLAAMIGGSLFGEIIREEEIGYLISFVGGKVSVVSGIITVVSIVFLVLADVLKKKNKAYNA